MHKLKKQIESCGGEVVRYNTDCISAYFSSDKKIKEIVANTYWDDEKTTLKYKFEEKDDTKFDKFNGKMIGYTRTEKFRPNLERKWNVINDDDNFDKLVDQIVESKQSILINGRAGCGKSTLLKKLMTKLNDNYIALAPTNKACRIIDGKTIHSFLAESFNNKKTLLKKLEDINYIIVDEISMVKEIFYKIFLSIRKLKPNIKFILCGDFLQLLPVNDRFHFDYQNSQALFELCDGNKLQLTKCRRADDTLFNLCNPLTMYKVNPSDFDSKFTMRHLSFTNKKRIEVNNKCMSLFIKQKNEEANKKKKKQPTVLKLAKLSYDKNSQDVQLIENMPVIARINCKEYNIANNDTYTITKFEKDTIFLKSDLDQKNVCQIKQTEFQKYFHVAFCITIHRSQGCTFDHPYTLHEWNLYDYRLKYVALSRATKKEYINIL
jgi:ATP-dependent exoDNAse (exonuclease V) alpha subunit